jgi:hypothetical protein
MFDKKQRVELSKKIVSIPTEIKNVEETIAETEKSRSQIEQQDSINKQLQNSYDFFINSAQKELSHIDSIKRTEIEESRIENASRFLPGNGFFLADLQNPIPSVPDGVWKNFTPMAFTFAVGKKLNETFDFEPEYEEGILPQIASVVASIKTFSEAQRATGKICVNQSTPPDPPIIGPEPIDEIQDGLNDLKNKLILHLNILQKQKTHILTDDPDSARNIENQQAINSIENYESQYNLWLTFDDFVTPFSCSLANSPPPFNLTHTSKLRNDQLLIIENIISERQSQSVTRKNQLVSRLGSIIQDLSNGRITSESGWYGKRYQVIDLRLNLTKGTSVAKFSIDGAVKAQREIQESNKNAANFYSANMKATLALSPATDTNFLIVENPKDFNVGDKIYVVAENQEELTGTILSKNSNRLELSFKVPAKYTLANQTRLYKMLSFSP